MQNVRLCGGEGGIVLLTSTLSVILSGFPTEIAATHVVPPPSTAQ